MKSRAQLEEIAKGLTYWVDAHYEPDLQEMIADTLEAVQREVEITKAMCCYSCPQSEYGCCDPKAGSECNCSALSARETLKKADEVK